MRPPGSGSMEGLGRIWKHALRFVSREHAQSLADQAVVSGTSFLSTLLIARWSGSGQLGIYAFGMSLLLSSLAFQDSLILQPYVIQRYYPEGTSPERAGASLTLSNLFSIGSILVLIVAAYIFLGLSADPEMVVVTSAIAGIVPFALTREFVRRYSYARLDVGRAFILDLAAAITQLSALIWLGVSGRLSALSACVALGGACAFPTTIWFYYARREFRIRLKDVRKAFKQTWALGKWLLAGRVSVQVQGVVTYWISMAIAGAPVTGQYAACMSIVGIVNPLLMGLTNVLMPKLVLAWKEGGGPGLWHEAIRNTVLIAALVVPFTLVVLVAGDATMRILYHSKDFEGLGHILTILVIGMSAGALSTPASNALAVMERPRAIVVIAAVAGVLTVLFVSLFMVRWGLLGAAYGLLGGTVVGAVGRWVAFSRRVSKVYDPTPVMRALQGFATFADSSDRTIARLGNGQHAEIFLVQSKKTPIWHNHYSLVAKLYQPAAKLTTEMVHAQFNSLSSLYASLDDSHINGWKISVPQPLGVCTSPLALVMTAVPGKHIDFYTPKSDPSNSKTLIDAARTCAMAMQQCWARGQRHGDLALQNVLFNLESKEISFVDAGTPESCITCDNSTDAEVCDLAHLLCDATTDVMDVIGRSTMRTSREMFIENVLLTVIKSVDSAEDERRLLSDIWLCAQQHLADSLEESFSILGVWNRFVKRIAVHRIRSILERASARANIGAESSKYDFARVTQLKQ